VHYRLERVVGQADLAQIRSRLEAANYVDGRATASGAAADVKRNMQLDQDGPLRRELGQMLQRALSQHEPFSALAFPKVMAGFTFARYEAGMTYGAHVDAPFLNNGMIRADISMTVFLNEPDEYEGGELTLDLSGHEVAIKLPAGDAFIYPTTYLHRVAPVRSGLRQVAVTWIQSFIPDARHREMAVQLNGVKQSLETDPGRRREAELLRAAFNNLLREWWRP